MIIGIDPGVSGGIALVGDDLCVDDVPTYITQLTTKTKAGNKKKRTDYDLPAMRALLVKYADLCNVQPKVVIETSNARPGESPHAAFKQGWGLDTRQFYDLWLEDAMRAAMGEGD